MNGWSEPPRGAPNGRVGEALGLRLGLRASGLGFAAGVGLFYLLPAVPGLWPLALSAMACGALAWRVPALRPLAFGALGLVWAQVHACRMLCEPFPGHLIGDDLQVVGRIASLPVREERGTRFLFRIEQAHHGDEPLDLRGLVRLSWYREAPVLRAGERRQLVVRLKPPHGFVNPGGFDYERWLFQQGVRATGYVRPGDMDRMLDSGPGVYRIDRWRQRLAERLTEVLDGSSAAGLVQALVLGERSGIGRDEWEVLTRTGTNHLIAISGLHVGLVAAALFFLGRWAWSRSARLVLWLAAPRAGALAAMAGALAYSALAGFAVSTQRALVMTAVVLGALVASRTLRPASGLVLALVGVLAVDPAAVLSFGFWLSFLAVAVLLYAMGGRLTGGGLWRRWGRAQWAVALGLLPMLLLLFGRASVVAPLVNLVAVPLFSLVLLPLVLVTSLLALVPGLGYPLVLAGHLLEWGFAALEATAGWEWAAVSLSGRPFWVWVAAFAGALVLLAPRGLPGRWAGLVLLLPLPLVRPPVPAEGEAWFSLLDVGQGLSAVVRTRSHTLVYDTGPGFASGFNTGSAVVLPFLKEAGVARIDTLMLSHGDRDHIGGFRGLAAGIPVRRILAGEPGAVADAGAEPCRAGQRWHWDGVDFAVLHPSGAGVEGNGGSCVLRVGTGGTGVLLPGDIEEGVEAELVERVGGALASDVLVAAHHGSATSTSGPFLRAVAPRWVLYSTGFADRFGFPSAAVRRRVAELGAGELDTAGTGMIGFRLRAAGLDGPSLERTERRRLWRPVGPAVGGAF